MPQAMLFASVCKEPLAIAQKDSVLTHVTHVTHVMSILANLGRVQRLLLVAPGGLLQRRHALHTAPSDTLRLNRPCVSICHRKSYKIIEHIRKLEGKSQL